MCRIILRKQVRDGTNEVTNVRVIEQCHKAVGDKACSDSITVNEGREYMAIETKPTASSSGRPRPVIHQAHTSERYYRPEISVSLEGGRLRYSLERSALSSRDSQSRSSPRGVAPVPPKAPSPPPRVSYTSRPGSSSGGYITRSISSPYITTTRTPSSTHNSSDISSMSMPPSLLPMPRSAMKDHRARPSNLSVQTNNPRNHDSAYYSVSSPPSSSGIPSPVTAADDPTLRSLQREQAMRAEEEAERLNFRRATAAKREADRVEAERRSALQALEGRSGAGLNERTNYYDVTSSRHHDSDYDDDEDLMPPSLAYSRSLRRTAGRERGDADETERKINEQLSEARERLMRDAESVRFSGGSVRGTVRRRRERGETRSEDGDRRGFGRSRDWFGP